MNNNNNISTWSSNHGFRFSPLKIIMVIFQKKRLSSLPALPPLYLQGFKISLQNSTKFLGLTFENKSSWTTHIKLLKAKYIHSLNILTPGLVTAPKFNPFPTRLWYSQTNFCNLFSLQLLECLSQLPAPVLSSVSVPKQQNLPSDITI